MSKGGSIVSGNASSSWGLRASFVGFSEGLVSAEAKGAGFAVPRVLRSAANTSTRATTTSTARPTVAHALVRRMQLLCRHPRLRTSTRLVRVHQHSGVSHVARHDT